ncbi:MAG TPA: serine/threonine-protein kinase [Burkholderiales bacterium]|nr:serine/threonine-protein kinase [Burkholderiales bacterium]
MPLQLNTPLAEGTRLENYRIERLLAEGGFSFVYLAQDENDTPVVIKEYLPSTLALRTAERSGEAGPPRLGERDMAKYRYGMKCFFEEGKALARLQHPNVVRVLNFFRASDSVYLVMRYERGRSLQEHIQALAEPPDEVWVRATFAQLLNGLREVHTHKLLHLDIKPANVYLREDGSPLLIDFGAARQTLSEEGMKLPPTYTPGFASPEHHVGRENLGPWSDIYSVGATVYACFAGAAPQPADLRVKQDRLVPARRQWGERYSHELLDIVDWCLRLDHLARPQSVFALQKALLGEREPERQAGGRP